MSNSKCNNSAGDIGRGPELKYEIYFPPNTCMPKDAGMSKCPDTFNYPLQNIPSCKSIYVPCTADNKLQNATNLKPILEPQPSELYGDALGMNEGTGLFYYNDPYGFNLTALTYDYRQPYHYARTSY
jgi:hypothetical protein